MRSVIIGLLIGLIVGLWFGVNIGKEKPFYSNPFEEKSLGEMIGDKGGEILEKGGKALEDTGKTFREKLSPKD